MSEDNGATPTATNNGQTPVPPVATPPQTPTANMVTLSKEEHDQLVKDAARASGNQRKATLYDRLVGGKGNTTFKQQQPVQLSEEERSAQAAEEDRKAERGLLQLAIDPQYREVLDADPTLRSLLTTNPLAILPVFAPDALDADDAITLVRDALAARKKPATPAAKPEQKPPEVPPVGAVNTKDTTVDEALAEARKHPNTETAIARMIGIKRGAKK